MDGGLGRAFAVRAGRWEPGASPARTGVPSRGDARDREGASAAMVHWDLRLPGGRWLVISLPRRPVWC